MPTRLWTEAGAITLLLASLKRHAESEGVIRAACGAFGDLCIIDDAYIHVKESGAFHLLLASLKRHEESEGVAKAACGALANMPVQISAKVVWERYIDAVISALKRHEASEEL